VEAGRAGCPGCVLAIEVSLMAVEGRRALLKERSAKAHEAVETAIGSWRSGADYRRYLAGMLAFRAPLEGVLRRFGWPRSFDGWRPVLIAPQLREDSRDLGWAPVDGPDDGRVSSDPSTVIGIAYVLEGSNLGARVLSRRATALGFTGTHGARHLASQCGGLDNWRRFLVVLEAADSIDLDRTVAAAVSTFEAAAAAFAKA
jgi:heme oxygenase (biliverdin-IX-beta and delta-forming)